MEKLNSFFEHWRKGKVIKPKVSRQARASTREHKLAVARGASQVVFKLLSKGSGLKSLSQVSSYISDGSKKEIITDSEIVSDAAALKRLKLSWLEDFNHRGKRRNSIDFVHVALSVPRGSDRNATEAAALAMLRDNFQTRRWMAVRHDNTDNPHVHVILQNRDFDNNPLPLRKADLLDYREMWAASCRAQGLNVEAILRSERGQTSKSLKMAQVKLIDRGEGVYFEDARRADGYQPPAEIQDARIKSLLETAADFAVEAQALGGGRKEKKDLSNHSMELVRQAKEFVHSEDSRLLVVREERRLQVALGLKPKSKDLGQAR